MQMNVIALYHKLDIKSYYQGAQNLCSREHKKVIINIASDAKAFIHIICLS
jgi:hypothetical protein